MKHLELFENFEAPTMKMQQSSTTKECPYCDSTKVKVSKWTKTGRVCNDCGRVWDINIKNKNE